ncbi:MAG: DUF5939 domain-containing protein [Anaerolineae bacterium]
MSSSEINERLFDEKLTQLESVRSWSPRVISRLETTIRTADDYDLFRINPLRYAADRNMAENEAIDLFLYGTKFGLFEMEWHLICPSCGHVVESFSELAHLHTHYVCASCTAEYTAALDDYIEVSFTISPQIRDNAFRHPDSLSIADYYLKYHLSKALLPTPTVENYTGEHSVMFYLEPQETRRFTIDLVPGICVLRGRSRLPAIVLLVSPAGSPEKQVYSLQALEGNLEPLDQPLEPTQIQGPVFTRNSPRTGYVNSGVFEFNVENLMERHMPMWLSNFSPENAGGENFVTLAPFLNGKKLLTTQTFRDLFRTEIVQADEGIGVRDITFLFTDLKGSTAMYDTIGDAKAYYLVRQHFDTLGKSIVENSGAVVKTIGDAVMATFLNPQDAVKAAIAMLQGVESFNRSISQEIILKIGIHRGHSIVVTLNDRLDYFGQTVNIAARVQGLADAKEIFITDDAFNTPGMEQAVADCVVSAEQVSLKGVSGKLRVHKITLHA